MEAAPSYFKTRKLLKYRAESQNWQVALLSQHVFASQHFVFAASSEYIARHGVLHPYQCMRHRVIDKHFANCMDWRALLGESRAARRSDPEQSRRVCRRLWGEWRARC